MFFDKQTLLEMFKIAPAIVALLIVIFLQYLLLKSKDGALHKLLEVSKGDIERYSKLITLLEVLINRKSEG